MKTYSGFKVVETAGKNSKKWLPALHKADVKVIHKYTSVRKVPQAEAIGYDAVAWTASSAAAQSLFPGLQDARRN
jgi:NAD(P)H-dependent flavin oxidoreductase YrpB (nitropropane dioxygenase family)